MQSPYVKWYAMSDRISEHINQELYIWDFFWTQYTMNHLFEFETEFSSLSFLLQLVRSGWLKLYMQ